MAFEATVSLHENPFENVVIWEKRIPLQTSKHRAREPKTLDTIVVGKGEGKDDYHSDYCVLAAATKGPSSQHSCKPVLLSDCDLRTHLSSSSYNKFAKTHTGGPVYAPPITAIASQPGQQAPVSLTSSTPRSRTNAAKSKQNEEDIKLFCCGRTVDSMVDFVTCMCCVKGVIYHCTKDTYDEGNMAEDPCTSCEHDLPRQACVSRWICMSLCSLFLPCVLCYLPARGCVQICTCYKRQRITSVRRQKQRFKDPH